ncbi:MAG: AAA family ATPase, partial [Micrococcales bacterium]|nr:AAA family ATPase [Micrococcales bacterium]
ASLDAATQTEADDAEALAELTERLAAAQTEPAQHEQAVAESTAARDEAAQAASAGRTRETEARLTLRTAEERARAMAGRAQSLERAAAAEREARERAAARERRRAEDARVAHAVHDGAAYTLTVTEQALAAAGDERAAADAARAARESELSAARADAEAQARELAELTDVAHRDEVARAAQVARLEQLHERSTVELGMDPQVLADEFGPDQMVPVLPEPEDGPAVRPYVRAEQEKRLRVAERALNQLGKVNPLALEEFAALEERHKFLVDQLSDLKKSKADLLQIVADIDERVLQVFTAAFLDTQAAFAEIFPRLFPGGEGRLVATDPDDMLTTGIEVEARPAGKKVKRLSLLSGGERSLAAVAMLVAIFKARPSPFYVLDEVEAALDDTNLGRLLGVLRELQSNSQLIVVTHQKRTMEIADALYGVSMRNDGISQIISQRLRESAAA